MAEMTSYSITDFLLFSRDVLFGIFEAYNLSIWPMQLCFLATSLMIIYLSLHLDSKNRKIISVMIALVWFWVGYIFQIKYFMQINWAAKYFGWMFFAQAVMFLISGYTDKDQEEKNNRSLPFRVGLALFVVSAFVPLSALLKMEFNQVLLFGWGADATALGTIGLVTALWRGWKRSVLLILPILWCLISFLMYHGLR